MNRQTLKIVACLAVALVSTTGLAAEVDEAQLVEKVAVRNRLYSVAGRWEVGANFGLTLLGELTDHFNLNLGVAYNVVDWLGIELRGGYAISGHNATADDIQQKFVTRTNGTTINDLRDMWEMSANAIVGVRFQPIYGKLNLVAELPVHFQLYVWLGGGAGLFDRTSVVLCGDKPGAGSGCREGGYVSQSEFKPIISGAIGFRFFIADHHGVKIEVRDWAFPDSYFEGVDGSKLRGLDATAVLQAGGRAATRPGITNLVQIDLGYSFIF